MRIKALEMKKKDVRRKEQVWAEFRFSVIGGLLASPPKNKGELVAQLKVLAAKTWQHPLTKEPYVFSWSTAERWYYTARRTEASPVLALKKRSVPIREPVGAYLRLSKLLF